MKINKRQKNYQNLINQISKTYLQGQYKAFQAVNSYLVITYWQIGKYIVEFEQDGQKRAVYGKSLIDDLAKDLSSLDL